MPQLMDAEMSPVAKMGKAAYGGAKVGVTKTVDGVAVVGDVAKQNLIVVGDVAKENLKKTVDGVAVVGEFGKEKVLDGVALAQDFTLDVGHAAGDFTRELLIDPVETDALKLYGEAASLELQRLQHRLAQGHEEVRETVAASAAAPATTGASGETRAERETSGDAAAAPRQRARVGGAQGAPLGACRRAAHG